MTILVANQKGGCGKTTIAMQFANFLAYNKGKELIVLDADFQGSFYDRREDDIKTFPENVPGYEVVKVEPEQISVIIKETEKVEGIVLIDFPGRLDNDNLIDALITADYIICPFAYDYATIESTLTFALLCKEMKLKAKIIFLPNRIKQSVKYETREDVKIAFSNFGTIAPSISDRVAMERASTLTMNNDVLTIVNNSFLFLMNEIKI